MGSKRDEDVCRHLLHERSDCLDRVGISGLFVVPVTDDSRESECDASLVAT